MHAFNRVIVNTGILYAKMGITVFISLYTTRLILNALGIADFGIFNVVGGAIVMLTFLNSAMAAATQRFMSYSEGEGDKEKQRRIFNVSVILHFIIALLVGIALVLASLLLFNGILNIPAARMGAAKLIYQFLIISTMLTIMTVPYDAILNAHENMLYFAIVGIVESLLKLGTAFVVVYTMHDKLIIYGFLMACISLIVMIVMRMYCHQKYEECLFAPKKYYNKKLMKEMTGFAGWSFLGSASSMISGYGSGIILNHFFGTILNAANGIAGQINGQLHAFSNTMQMALNPVITKSEGEGQRSLMIKATLSGNKLSFLIFAFLAIPFLIETSYILHIWLKNVPAWAVLFCQLAAVNTLIEQITRTLGTAIAAVGNIKRMNVFGSIIFILNMFILIVVFKMGFPPYFFPASSILVSVLMTILKLYYAKIYCGISYRDFFELVFSRIFVVFGVTFGLGLLPLLWLLPSIIRLVIVCLFSSLVYMVACYFIAFSADEKRHLNNLKQIIRTRLKFKLRYAGHV